MFITELFESSDVPQKLVVILPGGYHPFHPGHLSLYNAAKQKFPNADIYLASTDDRKERPFPFEMKRQLAQLAGIPADRFVQVKSPFQAKEIVDNYDPNSTTVVFVRSEKDRDEQPKPGGVKKDGSASYLQPYNDKLQPSAKHAYIDYLPTVQFKAGKSGITSASQIREMWPNMSPDDKAGLLTDLYPVLNKKPALISKLSARLDSILGGLTEEAAGVGQIATSRQKNDPRYSMSLTRDVRPGTLRKQLNKFHLESADDLDEMAVKSYDLIGDFDKPGPFRGANKKLVAHPVSKLKTIKFFEKTPHDFRLFFANVSGTGKHSEIGAVSEQKLRKIFPKQADQILADHEDAITVVFVGNTGADPVVMTPWIMAHRIGHACRATTSVYSSLQEAGQSWREAENHFFKNINQILSTDYKQQITPGSDGKHFRLEKYTEYAALFNAIGTQRSSRMNQIRRPYEFMYEMFAQYIKTGHVTLNPLPDVIYYGKKAWGKPTKGMRFNPESAEYSSRLTETLARDMDYYFNEVLVDMVGKVLVM